MLDQLAGIRERLKQGLYTDDVPELAFWQRSTVMLLARLDAAEAVAQWTVSEANSLGGLPMGLGKLGKDIAAWRRIVEEP